MKKFIKKVLTMSLSILLTLTISVSAFGLEWNGSGTPVNPGGESTGSGYRANVSGATGYRFSVIDYEGGTVKSSIDILNKLGYNADSYFSGSWTIYRFKDKKNKIELKKTYNTASFSTLRTKDNVFKDSDLGIELPEQASSVKSTVNAWSVRDAICRKLGLSGASDLETNGGWKLVVEPLYNAVLDGTHYHCCTPTEIAVFGRSRFGGTSNGGWSSTSDSWGYIADYTNRQWPGSLYLDADETFITKGGPLLNTNTPKGQETFNNIITKGYGVAFAYNNTNPPITYVTIDTTMENNPNIPSGYFSSIAGEKGILLEHKKSDGTYENVPIGTLLEEGQTYRAYYYIKNNGDKCAINFYDYNSYTDSRTYNGTSYTLNKNGILELHSNDFTITNNANVSDNYDYASALLNISTRIAIDKTTTASFYTPASSYSITYPASDVESAINWRYVTYKPNPENHLSDTTGVPEAMKASIQNSVNNKNLYSGQIVKAYATYTNNSSFNNKLRYSWNFNFPTYYYTNDATYQAYNNGTESAYLAPGGSVSSDTAEQRVYNGSNDLNNTRQVTLTSSAGELTYINATSSNNRINTDTDTYNVYPTDLVASNVYFTDAENGNMLETVKSGQRVIAHYIFTNETKIPVWCTITVGHDNGTGYEHTETLVIAGNNGTASISGSPFTVNCMGENKICAYASIYLGDMNGDTSHENDGTNNVIRNSLIGEMGVIQIETPFVVEKIENNAEYKRGITVVSSYKVKNNACRDYGTSTEISSYGPMVATLYIYKDAARTEPLNYVFEYGIDCDFCIPEGEETLVWFQWTVPDDCPNKVYATVIVDKRDCHSSSKFLTEATEKTNILTSVDYPENTSFKFVEAEYNIGNVVISTTPDTDFTKSKAFWYNEDRPTNRSTLLGNNVKNSSQWKYWTYNSATGEFVEETETTSISGIATITPKNSFSAKTSGKKTMKSGYGFTLRLLSLMSEGDNYTLPQYAYATFPEFNYQTASNTVKDKNNNKSLYYFGGFSADCGYDSVIPDGSGNIYSNSGYELGTFSTLKRLSEDEFGFLNSEIISEGVHFTPIWFPDGTYRIMCFFDECWTPGGKISGWIISNSIDIEGSMYDDYLISKSSKSGVILEDIEEPEVVLGDTNGSGSLDAHDITRLNRILSGQDVSYNEDACDINGDGVLNILDLNIFRMYYVGGYDIEISYGSSWRLAGDVNGDGKVDNDDLDTLEKYLGDWNVSFVQENLDINGDGKVNNKDFTKLYTYLNDRTIVIW